MTAEPKTPHYQVKYDLHLPVDPPWREFNRNKHRIAVAHTPDKLFVAAMGDLLQMLDLPNEPQMIAGLLLNMINSFPDEARQAISDGISQGMGLTLVVEKGKIAGHISKLYDSLAVDGLKQTKSGLVIPEGAKK